MIRDISESTLQAHVMWWVMEVKHHHLIIPNSTLIYRWEADLLSVTRAGLIHEFEIKTTPSDYRADFSKRHKHQTLEIGGRRPNYFWYVTWEFLVDPPPYAGLIRVRFENTSTREWLTSEVIREAPRLHGDKILPKQVDKIGHLLSYRVKNLYSEMYLNHKEESDGQSPID